MTIATLNTSTFAAVVTTAAETVFQARNGTVYLTTDSDPGAGSTNAHILEAGQSIVISTGQDVIARLATDDAELHYMVA